jgi:hypothetical protein
MSCYISVFANKYTLYPLLSAAEKYLSIGRKCFVLLALLYQVAALYPVAAQSTLYLRNEPD